MDKISTNVLIMGKSGAGKSSLLNYLFDKKLEETGSGKPVTKKDIYKHSYEMDNEFTVNIYDTWGLEPTKTEEWEKLVKQKIKKHDAASIKDWFHTLIYCINVNTTKVEEFELNFIKNLLNDGNRVLIVFTHCDIAGTEIVVENMKKLLINKGIRNEDIIKVCSEEKKLIGRPKTTRFGKEELFKRFKEGLWEKIVEKIPIKLINNACTLVDETTIKCKNHAEEKITVFTYHSNRNYEKINEYCSEQYKCCANKISAMYNKGLNDAIEYYVKLCQKMYIASNVDKRLINEIVNLNIRYNKDFTDKLAENVAGMIFGLIPIVNLFIPKLLTEICVDEYNERLDDVASNLKKQCAQEKTTIENYLKKIWR